jgi:hypothetical protein
VRRSQWWGRVTATIFVFVGTFVVAAQLQLDPEPVRLALVIGVAVALLELAVSVLDAPRSSWNVDPIIASAKQGRDAQFATYLRILEGNLSAKTPGPVLQNRLAALADRRLMLHHGLRRDDPRAAALLGPELVRDLDGQPRRLSLDEVESHLTRIEAL